jgi:hypothetical protein
MRPSLWGYMAGILKNLDCCSIPAGGFAEHIRILCKLSKKSATTIVLTTIVLEIVKKEYSKWVTDHESGMQSIHWHDGYGCLVRVHRFLGAVRQYNLKQEEYHKKISFQE